MKKVLALVMALALVFSLGVSALAADTTHTTHATKPETPADDDAYAALYNGIHGENSWSGLNDGQKTAAKTELDDYAKRNAGIVGAPGDSTDVSTDIYLKIAADDDLPPKVEVRVIGTGEDGQFFVIDYTDTSKSKLSATVPLYVCLYAYGQSGGVATPAETSYKIQNDSTYSVTTKIDEIWEYYPIYTSVVDMLRELVGPDAVSSSITTDTNFVELHGDDKNTKLTGKDGTTTQTYEDISTVIASNSTRPYYYFQGGIVKAVETNATVVKLDGQGDTKFFQTNHWNSDTSANPNGPKDKITVNGENIGVKKIGDPFGTDVPETYIALTVSDIVATTYGWTLTEATPLQAKELYLTINKINIAGAVGSPLALDGSDWIVKAGTSTTKGELGLKLNAAIAPNVNEYGEAAVVNVAYTLKAMIDKDLVG